MESYWQKINGSKKEEEIKDILSAKNLIDLLEYLIDKEKDIFKNKMERPSKDDFYKEAMEMNMAKGGCIALEQFKLKLISYVGKA